MSQIEEEPRASQVAVGSEAARGSVASADHDSIFVETVSVRHFRGVTSCELDLEPGLTLLVGANSSGKSRLLRAIAIALGGASPELDDLTVGSTELPTIDVVISPPRQTGDEAFEERYARVFRSPQEIRSAPSKERFAWRTSIRRSAEGLGVRSESNILVFDIAAGKWVLPSNAEPLTQEQRRLLTAIIIEPNRDLSTEFSRRGSAIRRILDELEVEPSDRAALEASLAALGREITAKSASLLAVGEALEELERLVGALGSPKVQPLPARLEELARSVAVTLNSGSGDLPIRMHGSGARSLASLQVQGVMYERRLGADASALRSKPVSLVEEPEAHLHPQAQAALASLLSSMKGQVIASTHSSQLVAEADSRAVRVLRPTAGQIAIVDFRPKEDWRPGEARIFSPDLNREEVEKLKRLVERPFGELLFSSCIVLGDGATERAFLPPLLRHTFGSKASTVSVVDPGSMNSEYAVAVVKFAKALGIPWFLFSDSDADGEAAARNIDRDLGAGDGGRIIWVGQPGTLPQAIEAHMIAFDSELCETVAQSLDPNGTARSALHCLKAKKGVSGGLLAAALIEKYPNGVHAIGQEGYWPDAVRTLLVAVEGALSGK